MTESSVQSELESFLLASIRDEKEDTVRAAAERFELTPQAVNWHLRSMVARGLLIASGSTRSRKYELAMRQLTKGFSLDGTLEEDVVWTETVAPFLGQLPRNVRSICQYGFTEMLNNAIDHSDGDLVLVDIIDDPLGIEMIIKDNGIGIFRKIKEACHLDNERHSVLELAKGKLTTDPSRHSGEGIFFTSRMFDHFGILSGHLYFGHLPGGEDWLMDTTDYNAGTLIRMKIGKDTKKTPQDIYDQFTTDDFSFDMTQVPVFLAEYGEDNLVSRSQAKRLLARFERFKKVVLDFKGVTEIGQAFADEVFRVFRQQHPEVELVPVSENAQVSKMIRRATESKSGGS